ncbi:hypothetical protein [Piscinibacterium candidicorallinum]|uniref:DUF2059 domain-containing protein n=1 Tax=Piscinibacterium candidicorallinum TaxID=1793872 RepID=A0ABV7HBF8_9BURK
MNVVRALLAAIVFACSLAQAAGQRDDVLRTFREYAVLNADFVRSVSAGTGISGKSYAQLRREAEAYAEGPFEVALRQAQQLLCSSQDDELLATLLRVVAATANSSSESPTDVLVHVAKCQPAQFRALAAQLPEQQRARLVRRSPELKAALKLAARER